MVAIPTDVSAGGTTPDLFASDSIGAGVNLFERAASHCGSMRATGVASRGMAADDSMVGVELENAGPCVPEGAAVARAEPDRDALLSEVLELNPTATSVFLTLFTVAQLAEYRDHLVATREPRGRVARWERRATTPAIVWRDSDAGGLRGRATLVRG